MSHVRFIGLDVHAETIAVAVAEPDGEVRSLGVIPNRSESIRQLVTKLGPPEGLRVCDEAGPTGYVVYWQLTALGVPCEVVALRGIALVSAAPIVSEVGELSRFANPRQLMGYSGAVAREDSSGERTRRGGITKTGNAHLRRIVIEAAWGYRHRPAVGAALRKRQAAASVEVKAIAWKAQHRLHARYRALTARGKCKQQVVTALGRELLGFIWATGVHVESETGCPKPIAA